MGDLPPYPDSKGDHDTGQSRADRPPPRPRWVYVFMIIMIVLRVLFVILHLTGHQPTHG